VFVGRVANLKMPMWDVSLFHKKTAAVNSSSVELLPVSIADLFENPTVCRVDACDAASAEPYQSLKPKIIIKSETHSNTGTPYRAIQPAVLIDVYHPSDKVYQSDMFDDSKNIGNILTLFVLGEK